MRLLVRRRWVTSDALPGHDPAYAAIDSRILLRRVMAALTHAACASSTPT